MKRVFFALFAVLVTAPVFAQNTTDTIKVQFSISDSLDYSLLDSRIIKHVYRIIVDYINNNGYVQDPDDHELNQIMKLESKDEFFANLKPSTHNPVKGGIYNLKFEITSEQRCLFIMTHLTKQGGDKIENNTDSYSIDWLQNEQAQKLVAYELIEECFGPTEAVRTTLNELRNEKIKYEKNIVSIMSEQEHLIKKENKKYAVLSFLPPVNQLRSHTSKGATNGVAILAGYGISVCSFIISTNSYNANKRKFDNISVDLTESNKAKEHYKGQMDFCRGGQIVSGIMFVGTYIYGVTNALVNRNTYQKKCKATFAPVAFNGGAGVDLVYEF